MSGRNVVAISGEEARRSAVPDCNNPEPIVLDLKKPIVEIKRRAAALRDLQGG
jgi:hypothetical protein